MSGNGDEPETIEGTAVEEGETPRVPGALVPTGGAALAVTPTVKAAELVARLGVIREAQQNAMVPGVDYGRVPGTQKPTLLKPGAEKLSVLFQLDVQLDNEKRWEEGGHLTVVSRATAFHAPSGTRLGFGEGVCTTRERKYAKRKQERLCPACGKPAVIKGKTEYGGGWLCFKKKDGCGEKWSDGAAAIEGQDVGEIDNPDLPDLWNTIVKMAEKRARVDAVLAVTGASALFTQDVEDAPEYAGTAAFQAANAEAASEPAQQAAESPAPSLAPDRVEKIRGGFSALKLSYRRIGALLGSCGIDGLRANSAKAVEERVGSLAPEQADRLEAALERLAQDEAAEASGE